MGGLFGTITRESECARDLFYGTDYHSHLGTRRAGMATYSTTEGFFRSIHSLESSSEYPGNSLVWYVNFDFGGIFDKVAKVREANARAILVF